jgi:glutamate synthase domain-containing protein 3
VLDVDGSFPSRVNPERIDLERLTAEDEEILQRMVRRHYEYTRSEARGRRAPQVEQLRAEVREGVPEGL